MHISDIYGQLPHDLSGSISKNRFRQELLWGVSKAFDLLEREDFCIIFDYKCDIELHFSDRIQFYQIKTHRIQRPYSFTEIKKHEKEPSIIAKLFLLQDISGNSGQVSCALVSNAFFRIGKKTISDVEKFSFTDLSITDQAIIKNTLKQELNRQSIDISNLYYIYTSMDLLNPHNNLKGKIIGAFERIKGCEPIKPNALYRLIVETAEEKACYELSTSDYNEIRKKKGLTSDQINALLDKYMQNADDAVAKAKEYIEQKELHPKKRYKLNLALTRIVETYYNTNNLEQIEQTIVQLINVSPDDLTTEELIEQILSNTSSLFAIEHDDDEKYAFVLLIIKRWESGQYE